MSRDTTVQTGNSTQYLVTVQRRFSKNPPNVTAEGSTNQESTVVLSTEARAASSDQEPKPMKGAGQGGGVRYADLPPAKQEEYRKLLIDMNKAGRLWVEFEPGGADPKALVLRRVTGAEVKTLLDDGKPFQLVTRVGSETSTQHSESHREFIKGHIINRNDVDTGDRASDNHTEKVRYSASAVSDWQGLDFETAEGRGVTGTAFLPASGGEVQVSRRFEETWNTLSDVNTGLIWKERNLQTASGFSRIAQFEE